MRKASILVIACIILLSTTTPSQTRRRSSPKRSTSSSKAAGAESTAEMRAGRERVAAQIKTMTRFLYLFGGIAKGIESADQAMRNNELSPAAIQQNEQNKKRIRESIRNVREGLDKLEADLRFNPALKNYYTYVAGVARLGEAAENQAAANRFDEAGRSLLEAVGKLADALVLMQ